MHVPLQGLGLSLLDNWLVAKLIILQSAIAVCALGWTLWTLRRPYHISKDHVEKAISTSFPMTFSNGCWSAPALPRRDESSATLHFWRVPSSLFFGLTPTRLGDRATFSEARQVMETSHVVVNPAEQHRQQEETFRMGKLVGVILRGDGPAPYGWTSQKTDVASFPKELLCRTTELDPIAPGDANRILTAHAMRLRSYMSDPLAYWAPGAHCFSLARPLIFSLSISHTSLRARALLFPLTVFGHSLRSYAAARAAGRRTRWRGHRRRI